MKIFKCFDLKALIIISLCCISLNNELLSQCTPQPSDTCEYAPVLCALDSVNGYTCKNTDRNNTAGCKPLCPTGGIANNISWWSFITNGGSVTIKISVSNCSITGTGVQLGIWGNCSCTQEIACEINCQSATTISITANLNPCQKYYFFVDGCTGDVCDFTISTEGGGSPKVPEIRGILGRDTLCPSTCAYDYFVDSDTSLCEPKYKWTIDGVEFPNDTTRKFTHAFETEGSFVLCVTGRLDNSKDSNATTCASFGPVCKTIFVTPAPVLYGAPINLCSENIPYNWHGQPITISGTYTQRFTDNCCSFDSTLTFVVKPPPAIPDIYYLGCKGDTYTDTLNKVNYTSCQNGIDIKFKNATIDKCDSAMRLFVTFLDLDASIKEYCEGGKIVIEATPNDKTCNIQNYITLGIDYNWYTMSNPGTIINSTPKFVISNTEKYCVDITLRGQLNNLNHQCTFTFCELLNEDDLKPKMVCPKGDLEVCQDDVARYTSDTIFPNNVQHIWTVTNGTILTPNPINNATIDIKWDFNAGGPFLGKICYHYESDCPPSPECCITINVQPYPKPNAGPDKTVCGLLATLDGKFDAGGTWTQYLGVPGTISPNDVANPQVSSSNFYGTCGYILTESRFGCTTRDTVLVTFNEIPSNSTPSYVCEPAQTSYTMKTDILKGKAPFTIVRGNGMIVNGNTYMSGIINNSVIDTIIIKDANDCEVSIIHSHECNCDNEIGKISQTLQKVCEDQLVYLIYDKTGEKLDPAPNRDTVEFFIITTPGDISTRIATLTSNTIAYNPALFTYGVTYYIAARLGRANGSGGVDGSKGCIKTSFNTPFIFVQNPKPIAGRDTSVCGNMFLLDGFQSIAGSAISWREVNGKSVKFQNFNQSSTTVEAMGGFGTYEFELKETNDNLCTRTSNVKITFNENPDISLFSRICTELGSSTTGPGKYKATIEIKSGNPPYTLITPPSTGNGTINGNIWMSNDIVSNDSFIVQVKDINGCLSTIIRNTFNCNCGPIDAGVLDSILVRACQDRCVAVKSLIPETIDPTIEATMYVLHKGRNLTAILDTFYNLTDSICYNPKTMQLGINNPIFVTRIVGDDKDKDGNPDLDDDCKRVSNEFKIVFDEYPSPNAGIDDTICGLTANLSGVLSFGIPTWTLVSGPGLANITNGNQINTSVTVSQKGTYVFNLLGDNFNCQRNDQVQLLFVDQPIFDTSSIIYECDNEAENYRIRIRGLFGDRASWNLTGVDCNNKTINGQFIGASDVWESDFIPTGCSFVLRLKDRFDCATDIFNGNHICNCITKIDDIDLTPVHLCEDQSIRVIYPQAPDTSALDANDIVRYVLYDGVQNDPRNGIIISVNSTGNFNFQNPMITGKTYFISVFVGNIDQATGNVDIKDRCFAFTPGKPVTWYKYPQARITGDTLLTCTIVNISLDASSSISGSSDPLRYKWSTNDTTKTINVNINGVYVVTVTDPRAGCTSSISFNVNRKVDLPKIAIDTPLKFTCDRTLVNVDGNRSDKGADFRVTWSGPGVVSGANTYQSSVNQTGSYKFLLENTRTGCRDSVLIPVGEDKRVPSARITQVGRLGCVVKEIKLDGSSSTGSAGTISNYTWIGNVLSGQNTSLITIGSPGGKFILEVKDSNNGCIDRDTIDITEEDNPLALIVLDSTNPKCFGERNGSISIVDIVDKNGISVTDIDISINGGPFTKNRNYNNLPKGIYNVTVRDSKGCLLSSSKVLIEPGPLNIIVKDTTVDQNSPVILDSLLKEILGGTVDQNGFYKDIIWKKVGDSIILTNKLIISDTTVEFTVTVIDQAGCEITKTVRINVKIIRDVWWPTVINPTSGLDENTRFNLYGKRVKSIRVLNIFSRWGELVYSLENFQDANKQKGLGWNGMYNGDYALPGVYAFYAEVIFDGSTDKEVVKGDFTLLR